MTPRTILGARSFALLLLASTFGAVAALSGGPAGAQGPDALLALTLPPSVRSLLAACAAAGLLAATRSYRVLTQDLAARARAEAEARAEALTDDLTGVFNRRGFRALAEHQLRIARRSGGDVLVLYLDLNGFKQVNDRFGHAEGDRALREVATLLRGTLRETDVIGRLGGDEFAVLVVDADPATEEAVRRRLGSALAARNARPDRRYALDFSLGTARFDQDRAAELDDLLRTADARQYATKRARRTQPA